MLQPGRKPVLGYDVADPSMALLAAVPEEAVLELLPLDIHGLASGRATGAVLLCALIRRDAAPGLS